MIYQHDTKQINQLADKLEDPELDTKGLGWKAAFHLRELQRRIAELEAKLYAIGAGGVGRMMAEPQQEDAPLHCDVCGVECANPWHFSTETERHKHACDACWGSMDKLGLPLVPLYTAPQPPVQQEPVAWMYEWNGRTHITTTDQRPIEHAHPHFNKSKPLYTAPQPTENLNCKSTQKRLATLWGYVKQESARQPLTDEQIMELAEPFGAFEYGDAQGHKRQAFARAIEEACGITRA